MYYTKVEEYSFRIPQEYKNYLAFRDELTAAGVQFLEMEEGPNYIVIKIRVHGAFKFDEHGNKILKTT